MVTQEVREIRVCQDQVAPMVHLDPQDLMGLLVHQELLERQAILVLKEQQEVQEIQDRLDLLDKQDQKGTLEV